MKPTLHDISKAAARCLLAASIAWCVNNVAFAEVVATLGNDSPGFSDGDRPSLIPQILDATNGQPAPFNGGIGSDSFADFQASWIFNYAPPAQPIGAGSVTIGIIDHDAGSPGLQIRSFSVDGFDLTSGLNALFEQPGDRGDSGAYNVYSLDLPSAAFASLLDGKATFDLELQGKVLSPPLLGGPLVEENFNGATLIFSSLNITPVPEPGTFALLGLGVLTIFAVARRRSR